MREDFSFENSYNINVGSLNVFPGVSETVLISFHPFFFFILFHGSELHHLSSSSLIHPSASVILLLTFSGVYFISIIVLFISCLYFIPILPKSLEGSFLLTLPKTVLSSLLLLYFYPSLTPI